TAPPSSVAASAAEITGARRQARRSISTASTAGTPAKARNDAPTGHPNSPPNTPPTASDDAAARAPPATPPTTRLGSGSARSASAAPGGPINPPRQSATAQVAPLITARLCRIRSDRGDGIRQQRHRARAFDGGRQLALMARTRAGDPAGNDLAALGE